MADISYTRSFSHADWIDNEDVVQAEGEKGFNQKFHELEAELDRISTVVGAIKNALANIQELADGVVTTPKLADNAVTARKIAAGAVTPDKIAFEQVHSGSTTVQPGAIGVREIVAQNVPNTKPLAYFPLLTIIGERGPLEAAKIIEATIVYTQSSNTSVHVMLQLINRGNVPAQVIWAVNRLR
jgi:hypothetical protein